MPRSFNYTSMMYYCMSLSQRGMDLLHMTWTLKVGIHHYMSFSSCRHFRPAMVDIRNMLTAWTCYPNTLVPNLGVLDLKGCKTTF